MLALRQSRRRREAPRSAGGRCRAEQVPLSKIAMIEPASAVPVRVGVVSLVVAPSATVPVSGSASSLTAVMVGAAGAAVSMTMA